MNAYQPAQETILVAYASKYGATAEVAEKIGQVLRQAGFPNDLRAVNRVGDLTPYRAVILGSAVYIGQWRKEASNFLKANEKALAKRLVWLFSSGPTGEGDPVELLKGWRFPKKLQPVADRIRPRGIAVFHGHLQKDKLSAIEKWMINRVKAPYGDFRNWEAITSWAEGIAAELKKATPAF